MAESGKKGALVVVGDNSSKGGADGGDEELWGDGDGDGSSGEWWGEDSSLPQGRLSRESSSPESGARATMSLLASSGTPMAATSTTAALAVGQDRGPDSDISDESEPVFGVQTAYEMLDDEDDDDDGEYNAYNGDARLGSNNGRESDSSSHSDSGSGSGLSSASDSGSSSCSESGGTQSSRSSRSGVGQSAGTQMRVLGPSGVGSGSGSGDGGEVLVGSSQQRRRRRRRQREREYERDQPGGASRAASLRSSARMSSAASTSTASSRSVALHARPVFSEFDDDDEEDDDDEPVGLPPRVGVPLSMLDHGDEVETSAGRARYVGVEPSLRPELLVPPLISPSLDGVDLATLGLGGSSGGTSGAGVSPFVTARSLPPVRVGASKDVRETYSIAMVCDFFYPRFGGVESHLYQLSQCLLARGHKVIIVTHAYNSRHGVRMLTNGLKVYHLPFMPVYQQSAFPSLFSMFPLLRNVFIREQVQIVHGHGAFSCMCHEAILHGRTMGYKVCFTDHSLFGFHDASSIHMNKVLKFTLSDIDHVICVSYTSKENTVLRAQLDPRDVSVIPNAVDTTVFRPNPAAKDHSRITIVVMSRLVYRKGVDLVIQIIPRICEAYPQVSWIIGGDGDKMLALEEMLEEFQLHDRVEVLGEVAHEDVRDVLVRGDIFLNSSLTEAFCIAIVEAVSCGLLVVSTRVGGVPEVLPEHMIKLADPEPGDLIARLDEAIAEVHDVQPYEFHGAVRNMYNWNDVAARTEVVYDKMMSAEPVPLIERFRRYYGCGLWAGKLFCMLMALDFIFFRLLEWVFPRSGIDLVPAFPTSAFQAMPIARKLGNPNMAKLYAERYGVPESRHV
ncbi:GlcNAc transferase [Thecamonas trahens ATCC 50062]|uniref:phosphatidylinositol N-acetylglucosaminyltransferase n=1 Tax=Thecamonas trahens ATCC 50062 TaxID=461836 RepID=A0A0L0D119_THETB|nr:GlcNAc transferase [Thecamonas trahens ATCC 50062]KNC45932.1 GlcNAc transferase [Thecamonas trahens ATCC 50062]|eukprot:XP_013762915.1 GlcNAc transferase [Thecamonas trahens ATCC 50062]